MDTRESFHVLDHAQAACRKLQSSSPGYEEIQLILRWARQKWESERPSYVEGAIIKLIQEATLQLHRVLSAEKEAQHSVLARVKRLIGVRRAAPNISPEDANTLLLGLSETSAPCFPEEALETLLEHGSPDAWTRILEHIPDARFAMKLLKQNHLTRQQWALLLTTEETFDAAFEQVQAGHSEPYDYAPYLGRVPPERKFTPAFRALFFSVPQDVQRDVLLKCQGTLERLEKERGFFKSLLESGFHINIELLQVIITLGNEEEKEEAGSQFMERLTPELVEQTRCYEGGGIVTLPNVRMTLLALLQSAHAREAATLLRESDPSVHELLVIYNSTARIPADEEMIDTLIRTRRDVWNEFAMDYVVHFCPELLKAFIGPVCARPAHYSPFLIGILMNKFPEIAEHLQPREPSSESNVYDRMQQDLELED